MSAFLEFIEPFASFMEANPLKGAAIVYLVIMNVYVFFLCRHDKLSAILGKERVPEKDFFVLSFFGGSIGMIVGMYAFRHKTKHVSFVLGIPFIMAVQACIVWFLVKNGTIKL